MRRASIYEKYTWAENRIYGLKFSYSIFLKHFSAELLFSALGFFAVPIIVLTHGRAAPIAFGFWPGKYTTSGKSNYAVFMMANFEFLLGIVTFSHVS